MPAKVTFLIGRAHTGKSDYIEQALLRHRQKAERATLLVPEQFTFEAERRLAERLNGLLGIQVSSFDRLSERVLSLSGYRAPFLSRQGLAMIVRREALRHQGELRCFAKAAAVPGFSAAIADTLSSFMRADVPPEALSAAIEKLPPGSLLSDKLSDIALLYESVSSFMAGRYIASDDAVRAAASALPSVIGPFGYIYIDGFEKSGHAVLLLTRALFCSAPTVTVSLLLDAENGPDSRIFAPNKRIYDTLLALAGDCGCRVRTIPFASQLPGRSAEAAFLERRLYAYPTKAFSGPAERITLYGASSREAEVERAADAIVRLSREGLSYQSLSVLASDMEAYAALLMRALQKRGVPAYLDLPEPLSYHAASRALLSALRASILGFAPADVLAAAKSGFFPLDADDVDQLDNYCLQYGLRPGALLSTLAHAAENEGAERARRAILRPLLALREALLSRSVSGKARAVYAFLTELGFEEQLRELAAAAVSAGRPREADRDGQVFACLTELLAQMDAILGELILGREAFLALMEEGLSARSLGAVPPGGDCVLVGDLDRTRSKSVDTLFVLGVNDGLLPRSLMDDGLIDDHELSVLSGLGLSVWQDTKALAEADALSLYSAFSKARRSVHVSFCFYAGNAEQAPSQLVSRLRRLFPTATYSGDVGASPGAPETEASALSLLARLLAGARGEAEPAPLLSPLYHCLCARPDTRSLARRMKREWSAGFAALSLPPKAAQKLYGRTLRLSPSRLETYNLCPFRHFLQYGLFAAERPVYRERSAELGMFYHDAMDAFIKASLEKGVDFAAFSAAEADAIMDEVLPGVIAAHNNGILLNEPRQRASLFLIVETAKAGARAAAAHFAAGGFAPLGAELRFGEGEPFPAIPLQLPDGTTALLSGVIDRVDSGGEADDPALRVVDYKTHGRSFDYFSVAEGLSLQLPLYLLAASSLGRPAGLYYMPLSVPAPNDGEDVCAALTRAFRLRGLTLSEPEVMRLSEKALSGSSEVLYGLRQNRDGSYKGPLVSAREMDELLDKAVAVSKRTLSAMAAGSIHVAPIEGGCDYCPYGSCCRFDASVPGCRTRKRRALRREEFFAGGEVAYELDD